MSDRGKVLLLMAIMTGLVLVATVMSLLVLFRTAFEGQRARLVETVQSEARLIEAMLRHEKHYAGSLPAGHDDTFQSTLNQLVDAHSQFAGFGQTGEFVLGKRQGDDIVFLLRHRHTNLDQPGSVPWAGTAAEPMRQALSGKSGALVGLDYRGTKVLAAFEPVAGTGWGIVAKIDLAEIRAPFLRAGWLVGSVVGGLALVGGFVVGRIGNRLVRRIAEREDLYRTLVENIDLGITLVDKDYRVVMTNASQGRMFNKAAGEFIGKFCYQEFEKRREVCSHCPGTRAMTTGLPAETETAGTLDDGRTIQVRIRAFPVSAGSGEITGFIEVIEDISEQKRVEAALHAGVKRLELLTWTAEELLRTTEPQEVVETLCHRVMETLDCQTFFNFMFDNTAGRLHLNACAGIPEEEARRIEWLDFGVAVCGCVARDCQRIVAEHIPTTPDERTELVKSYGIRAYACHPLLGPEGKLIGTLSFGTRNRDTFSEGDLSLMKAVANQVAVAMTRIAGKKALLESEKRLRRAVLHAPFPIIIHAEDGEVLLLSESWTDITGYRPEDIPTIADWTERAYGERVVPIREFIDRLYGIEGRVHDGEFQVTTKDGTARTWDFSSAPLGRTGDGRRTIISMAVDITERKAAETELRERKEFIETIIANLPIGLSVHTIDDGRFRYMNRNFQDTYGWPRETLLDVDAFFEHVYPDPAFRQEISAQIYADMASGDATRMVWENVPITRSSGETAVISARNIPMIEKNLMISTVWDVTAYHAAKLQLEATIAELQRSNRELEQFAYVASHDLQEPLRMVASYVQLLERRYRGRLDADADEFIDYAVEGATRMRKLINDLLTFSQVGRKAEAFEAVNCEKVLAAVLRVLKKSLEENGGTITHDPLPVVNGITSQVNQVFQNLLSNALKFHREEPPRIHISAAAQDNEWVFAVSDNGIGIDPQYFERIFLVFQRLHGKKEYPGTGIGLALCKKIIETHGGRIWIESQAGQGSTFYFTLKGAK